MPKTKKQKWVKIADEDVIHTWECSECHNQEQNNPDWYEQNGTPTCPNCNIDMFYVETLIRK